MFEWQLRYIFYIEEFNNKYSIHQSATKEE